MDTSLTRLLEALSWGDLDVLPELRKAAQRGDVRPQLQEAFAAALKRQDLLAMVVLRELLGEPLTVGLGAMEQAALSPNGQFLATGSRLHVWNVDYSSAGLRWSHSKGMDPVFSHDSQRLAFWDGTTRCVELRASEDGAPLTRIPAERRPWFAFTPDDALLVVVVPHRGDTPGQIELWSVSDDPDEPKCVSTSSGLFSRVAALHPDGQLAVLSAEPTHPDGWALRIFSVLDLVHVQSLSLPPLVSAMPRELLFDPKGRYLVVAHEDSQGAIHIWDWPAEDGAQPVPLGDEEHRAWGDTMAISPDGQMLVCNRAKHGGVCIYNMETRSWHGIIAQSDPWVSREQSLSISDTPRVLAVGCYRTGMVHFWKVNFEEDAWYRYDSELTGFSDTHGEFIVSHCGRYVVLALDNTHWTGNGSGGALLRDLYEPQPMTWNLFAHEGSVVGLDSRPDFEEAELSGEPLCETIVGLTEEAIVVQDTEWCWYKSIAKPSSMPVRCALAPNIQELCVGYKDGTLTRYPRPDWEAGAPFADVSAAITSLVYDHRGVFLAAGFEDGTVQVWALESKEQQRLHRSWKAHEARITCLRFCPVEVGRLFSSSEDGHVNVWSVEQNTRDMTLKEQHPGAVWSVALHPTQPDVLATACEDGVVRIWSLAQSTVLEQFEHARTRCVAFHPCGRVLLSGAQEGVVRFFPLNRTAA